MEIPGYVYYSPSSYAGEMTEDTWIEGGAYAPFLIRKQEVIPQVPVVLVSLVKENDVYIEAEYAFVQTDENGQYSFTNVDFGRYKVIEAFGMQEEGVPSTIDFGQNKQPITESIKPEDPSVEYILTLLYNTYRGNKIVSISPNTKLIEVRQGAVVDISGSSAQRIDSVDFIDAPQRCEAFIISDFLPFQNAVIIGDNLVNKADKGTFGTVDAGSAASGKYSKVYADQDFTEFSTVVYSAYAPYANSCAVTNIAAKNTFDKTWFDTPDHSNGDETGRFMIVNGDKVGQVFFKTNINIESNTVYLFSCWAMNIMRCVDSELPKFSIKIFDADTEEELFYQIFNEYHPMVVTEIPTWVQIGTILTPEDVNNRTNLAIQFISEGPEAAGNDYAIDDVVVVALKRGVVVEKKLEPSVEKVKLGGELTYKCTINNLNEDEAVTHVLFKDFIQEGVTIKDNVLKISCSDIQNHEIQLDTIRDLNATMDAAGINISRILSEAVQETDPNYVPLKLEKIPPQLPVTITFTVVVNSINETDPYSNVKNRFRVQFLSELDTQDLSRPRMVASNEVVTPVVFPVIKIEKGISKLIEGVPSQLAQGDGVYGDSDVFYEIKLTNSGKTIAEGVTFTDEFEDRFVFEFPEREPCSIRVTSQTIFPGITPGEEMDISCSSIKAFGNHGIRIDNLWIPAALSEEEAGVCILRVYGKIK